MMVYLDESSMLYALRSVHLAQHAGKGWARLEHTGISERILNDLKEQGYILTHEQRRWYKLSGLGIKELNSLGGPWPDWKVRARIE